MTEANKNKEATSKTVSDTPNDAVMARLQEIEDNLKVQLEEKDAQIEDLQKDVERASQNKNTNQDEEVDTKRRSAHLISLPIIEGSPIVKSEITSVLGIAGLELVAKVKNAAGDSFEVPFGCDIKKLDFDSEQLKDMHRVSYENLKTEEFDLVDIDENDLTGASKVEKGVVSSEGSLVPEVDRSTGTPIATGRKVRTTVRKDIRHYTIKSNGKKFTFTNEDLANIRI